MLQKLGVGGDLRLFNPRIIANSYSDKKLSSLEQAVFSILYNNIKTRVPKSIPIRLILNYLNKDTSDPVSYYQVRYAIRSLIKKGLVEKWSNIVSNGFSVIKINYYRIKI